MSEELENKAEEDSDVRFITKLSYDSGHYDEFRVSSFSGKIGEPRAEWASAPNDEYPDVMHSFDLSKVVSITYRFCHVDNDRKCD